MSFLSPQSGHFDSPPCTEEPSAHGPVPKTGNWLHELETRTPYRRIASTGRAAQGGPARKGIHFVAVVGTAMRFCGCFASS